LPYSALCFFSQMLAFNIQWRENPLRRIDSWAGWFEGDGWKKQGVLTKPGMANHGGDHSLAYPTLNETFPG